MIEFHRPEQQDTYSDKIEEKLTSLVVAHKIHRYPASGRHDLPYIEENARTVRGKQSIDEYLEELESDLHRQRMVSGDSCYIDPDTGEMC